VWTIFRGRVSLYKHENKQFSQVLFNGNYIIIINRIIKYKWQIVIIY
jgi:hypothetical protein